MGIDYSLASVELAKNVLQAEDLADVSVKVGSVILSFKPDMLSWWDWKDLWVL